MVSSIWRVALDLHHSTQCLSCQSSHRLTPPISCRNERVRCNLSNICGTQACDSLTRTCYVLSLALQVCAPADVLTSCDKVTFVKLICEQRRVWMRVKGKMQVWGDAPRGWNDSWACSAHLCGCMLCTQRNLSGGGGKCSSYGGTRWKAGAGGRGGHRRGERGWEHASARGEVRCKRPKSPGHLPRLPPELSQSGAQTSAVPALFLQEVFASTLEESGHGRAAELPGWQGDQTTWVTLFTNNRPCIDLCLQCMQGSETS